MSVDANQLLRALGSGVRPTGATPASSSAARKADVASGSFAELLQAVSDGAVSSGAPVQIAKSSGLKLSPAQLTRLADAADQAQAQGADRALVLMDGMALQLDVATRTVTGLSKSPGGKKTPQVLTGVDTVITVPSEEEAMGQSPPLGTLASAGVSNTSLLKTLSARDERIESSDNSQDTLAA